MKLWMTPWMWLVCGWFEDALPGLLEEHSVMSILGRSEKKTLFIPQFAFYILNVM